MTEFCTVSMMRELLGVQLESFRSAVTLLTGQINEEIKWIKGEVNEIKASLQYTQKDVDEMTVKISRVEKSCDDLTANVQENVSKLDKMEDGMEYAENQSRRNNVKLYGIVEESNEIETWADCEEKFKENVKTALKIEEPIEIERAHRVGEKRKPYVAPSGRVVRPYPRPIVAKLTKWKDREAVIQAARKIEPPGMKFLEDFSSRTLEKRKALIPKLEAARNAGKTAYFVASKLIIRENHVHKDGSFQKSRRRSRSEQGSDNETIDPGATDDGRSDDEVITKQG